MYHAKQLGKANTIHKLYILPQIHTTFKIKKSKKIKKIKKTTDRIRPELFDKDDTNGWKSFLEREGYVVIKNIIEDEEERHRNMDQFKKDWTMVSPNFDFSDKQTWGIENTPMVYGKGTAVYNGFGQSDFLWNLRLNTNIQNIFKEIHGTEELVVSQDGFSVFLSNKQKSKPWLHVDQNPLNPVYSIQGSYNLLPVGDQDAGFLVVPGSHKSYTPTTKNKKDWVIVDQEEFVPKSKKLLIPDNCFTLWNSKTIHSNVGIDKTKKNIELNRVTAYIAYLPKSIRSEATKLKKIQAYYDAKSTSHWANQCHIKTYPWGFGPRYETRGYGCLKPKLVDGKISKERLSLL